MPDTFCMSKLYLWAHRVLTTYLFGKSWTIVRLGNLDVIQLLLVFEMASVRSARTAARGRVSSWRCNLWSNYISRCLMLLPFVLAAAFSACRSTGTRSDLRYCIGRPMSIPVSSGLSLITQDDAENNDSDGDGAALVDKHLAELALDAPLQELAVTDADILM